ncbi:hypothetical protein DT603_14730 [Pseudoxanthomonas gei]|uniref:Uncharacterized protein n=1 Tax=Pseudoxanthomonas gei TaxID=1383030 RepID=A0ABX0AIQ8_9GAMM|nr:hypothetical protein [Pseudoxanthomonas gei]NDK40096.1 hypothetical protein [Pseudoxanthomonas gei]
MKLSTALLACAGLAASAWAFSSLRDSPAPAAAGAMLAACPLPPRVASDAPPLQTEVPASLQPFVLGDTTLQPLAGFSIEARVLSREDYRLGREAALSPTDLALGWQRMREDAVLSQLRISQSSRWYHYQWDQPPLPAQEIASSSANMHMIPANPGVAGLLAATARDDHLRIDGWLVEARATDGWRWRSSTSRTDSGGGACEVVYVCSITRL